jgi:tetratricopeptide (TPR) repeat protein
LPWRRRAGSSYEFSLAKWDSVLERIDTTIDLTQKAGDKRNWEVAMLSKGIALHMLGRWPDAIELCKQYLVSAEERGDNETQSWALAGLAAAHLRQGQPMVAQVHAKRVYELLLNIKETVGHIMIHGLLSQVYLRQADPEKAAQHAQEGLALMQANAPTLFTPYEGYCGVAEYYLWAWDHYPKEENRQPAADALKRLAQYGRLFQSGRPRLAIYRSWFNHLDGKNSGAQTEGHKALGLALEHQMPYDQALAHLHLSRTYPDGDQNKQDHLDQAKTILDELGGDFDKELLLIS